MHAGRTPLPATFWLIEAPDSLAVQSHANPDGAGIGCFGIDGVPTLDKQPLAAWQDSEFATDARTLIGTTFVAHVRYASTGGLSVANTHPFLLDGRLFAHNGVVQGLDLLDAHLDELDGRDLVGGQTDSERVFALIAAETRRHQGDLSIGLVVALRWIAQTLPLFSLNFVLTTATDLWALRYPDTHELYLLDRPPGGAGTKEPLRARSGRISARSEELADRPAVIVATERMDEDAGWRALEPGELVHVSRDLAIHSSKPIPPPSYQLRLSELSTAAAVSQQPATGLRKTRQLPPTDRQP
jgi:predicted glutamine amidotransferase